MFEFALLLGVLFLRASLRSYVFAQVEPEEYLDLLTHEWQEAGAIRRKMEDLKGKPVIKRIFNRHMNILMDEGLVEQETLRTDWKIIRVQYRLIENPPRSRRRKRKKLPWLLPRPKTSPAFAKTTT